MCRFLSRSWKTLFLSAILAACLGMSAFALDEAIAVGATTGSDLNLRTGPSTSDSVITRLDKSLAVAILDTSTSGWYKIAYRGMEGYVSADYMIIDQDGLFTTFGALRSPNTYVWAQPSNESPIVATIPDTMAVVVNGFVDGWYAVTCADGTQGYINSVLVDLQNNNLIYTTSQAVEIAKQYLGVPYRYGGASPSAFDCSGFTMYVFAQLGISLSHSASDQWNSGVGTRAYNLGELAPGDLVFFRDPSHANGKACSHVGIYLGNGQFINASSSQGVSTASLTTGYWSWYFIGGLHI